MHDVREHGVGEFEATPTGTDVLGQRRHRRDQRELHKLSCLTSAETKHTLDLIRLALFRRSGRTTKWSSLDDRFLDETFLLAGDDVEKLIALQSELSRLLRRVIDFPIGFISFHRRSKNF